MYTNDEEDFKALFPTPNMLDKYGGLEQGIYIYWACFYPLFTVQNWMLGTHKSSKIDSETKD